MTGSVRVLFFVKRGCLCERREFSADRGSAAFSLRMLKARYARDIFRLSAPNSVQQASGTIITTVKQGLLGGLGVKAIAGFSCTSHQLP